MNDRWSELAEECWDMRVNEWHFDQEMFAELIIRECVSVVENGRFLHDQAPDAIFAQGCSQAIERHFGLNDNV